MRRRPRRSSVPPAPPPDPEALAVRPVRTAEWSETAPKEREEAAGEPGGAPENRVVVERPLPPVRGISSLLQRISALTGVRRLRLDAPGSLVWRRMDGARTVGELAAELRSELGEPSEDAETRVVRFVTLLRREGLVALPGLDDERIAAWRARSSSRAEGGAAGNPEA